MTKFIRETKIEIGRRGETGQEWVGLTFDFQIKHIPASTPNKGTITIMNLPERGVEALRRDDAIIRVFAGHRAPKLIFSGAPDDDGIEFPQTQGQDTPVKILAQDGGRVFSGTHLDISLQGEFTAREVIQFVADQMGIPVGRIELPNDDIKFPFGLTFAGQASDVLDRIETATDSTWSIQDGRLRFLSSADGTRREVSEYSRENRTLIEVQKSKDGIKATVLLDPAIRPEDRFVLGDTEFSGVWRAGPVTFEGNSGRDTPFYTRIKAVPA